MMNRSQQHLDSSAGPKRLVCHDINLFELVLGLDGWGSLNLWTVTSCRPASAAEALEHDWFVWDSAFEGSAGVSDYALPGARMMENLTWKMEGRTR